MAFSQDTEAFPPSAHTALDLRRGITLDRQYREMPVPEIMQIRSQDIQVIRSMGFDFVKLIMNPAVHQEGPGLRNMEWVQHSVDIVVTEGLTAVICIHPETPFKTALFQDQDRFREYLKFQEAFARFVADHWNADQVAFQLMTEPLGTSQTPSDWNSWNKLQPLMWEAARRAMPEHTLILSGDQVGHIRGLITVEPVQDANVMYGFTTYDPVCFTHQKASWLEVWWPSLGHVPYPSSPEKIRAALPGILAEIPAEPADWRVQTQSVVEAYGEERWNKARQAQRIGEILEWNEKNGGKLKLWCAEFGVYGAEKGGADPRDRVQFIRDLREVFEEKGIGWSYWSFNETFTVLRPDHRKPFGEVKPEDIDQPMLEALGL